MPAKKIVSDIYTIKSPFVTIEGNLNVLGTQTTISTTDSAISDNTIILNDGQTGLGIGQGAPGSTAGVTVMRGDLDPVGIRYDEDTDKWQLTNDGSTWTNILSSAGSGLGLENVVEDATPQLGGDLDLNSKSLFDPTANVTVTFGSVASNGGGGSGVFVTNELVSNQELVIKRKAFIYALIF